MYLLIHTFIIFLRSWIIFTIITVNYFPCSLPISSLFIWSCRFLPCSFICNICLCLLILFKLLCLCSFCRLQGYIPLAFVVCPLVGEDGPGASLGFLVGVAGACTLVGGALFPLMDKTMSGDVFWGVCELILTLGSLSADGWHCVPVLLLVWCDVCSTKAFSSWVEPGLCVEMYTSRRVHAD